MRIEFGLSAIQNKTSEGCYTDNTHVDVYQYGSMNRCFIMYGPVHNTIHLSADIHMRFRKRQLLGQCQFSHIKYEKMKI